MGEYKIILNDIQEKFLDLYLDVCKLRSEHKRSDYPNLIVNNWVNSLMKREKDFRRMQQIRNNQED